MKENEKIGLRETMTYLRSEFGLSIVKLCAAPDKGTIRGGGIGLLVRVLRESFLVTAGHVIKDLAEDIVCETE